MYLHGTTLTGTCSNHKQGKTKVICAEMNVAQPLGTVYRFNDKPAFTIVEL